MKRFYKNIVKGDSYRTTIVLKTKDGQAIEPEFINHVYVTSKGLNINKEAEYDQEVSAFVFALTPNETKEFKVGRFTFDITVLFGGSTTKTVTYEGEFLILEKHNLIG